MPRFHINVRVKVEIAIGKQPMDQLLFAEPWIVYDVDEKPSDSVFVLRADCPMVAEGADKAEAIKNAKANAPALFEKVPAGILAAKVWVDENLDQDVVAVSATAV